MASPVTGQPGQIGQAKGRRSWPRAAVAGAAAGLVLLLAAEAGHVLLGRNSHAVILGRVYRCAQRSGERLDQVIRARGIRTVVNLRGCNPWMPWYQEECRATHALGVSQEDVCFSATRLPAVPELRRLIEVLDRTEYPILIHCRRGADRTGLAAAIVLLLYTDATLEKARRQLGPRYGHVPLGRTSNLDLFLDEYANWLRQRGQEHTRDRFRYWALNAYWPDGYRARMEPLEAPTVVPRGRPFAVRVRAHNIGTTAWRLHPGRNAGVHVGYILRRYGSGESWDDRFGLLHAEVAPGQSIDLMLALPALHEPGRYRVLVDMTDDRQQFWFFQMGGEPLEWDVTAE